jgi:hypothetical protein
MEVAPPPAMHPFMQLARDAVVETGSAARSVEAACRGPRRVPPDLTESRQIGGQGQAAGG